MTLAAGTKLGPYEILSLLGAGGMGEVYRPRDSRLGPGIAITRLCALSSVEPECPGRLEHNRRSREIANAVSPTLKLPFGCLRRDLFARRAASCCRSDGSAGA